MAKRKTETNFVYAVRQFIIAIIWIIFQCTLGLYLRLRYRITVSQDDRKKIKGGYLLLANHTNDWDGVLIQAKTFRVIHYVVVDILARNKVLGFLLKNVQYIFKTKFVADTKAIRKIIYYAKKNDIIGIFAEGMSTWDGKTVGLTPGTSNVAYRIKKPVIICTITGAYLNRPRWSFNYRRGRVDLAFKQILTTDDFDVLSKQEVDDIINKEFEHDEMTAQETRMERYKGKDKAECIELFLYVCPKCHAIGSLRSKGDEFGCTECDFKAYIDEYGFINSDYNIDKSIVKLNEWQHEFTKEYIDSLTDDDIIYTDDNIKYLTAESAEAPYIHRATGRLTLTKKRLIFKGEDTEFELDINKIHGNCMMFKKSMGYRYEKENCRFELIYPHNNLYKYNLAINIMSGYNRTT